MGVTVTYFGSGIRQELEPAEALRVVKLGLAWPDGGEEPRPERAVLAQVETADLGCSVLPTEDQFKEHAWRTVNTAEAALGVKPRTKKPGKKRKPLKGY